MTRLRLSHHFSLSLHFGSNPTRATRKWYDNVVAVTAHIGPMVAR